MINLDKASLQLACHGLKAKNSILCRMMVNVSRAKVSMALQNARFKWIMPVMTWLTGDDYSIVSQSYAFVLHFLMIDVSYDDQ